MDFFAAGGFQQLFSDLDEQPLDVPTVDAWLATDHGGDVAADISPDCYYGCRSDLFSLHKESACSYCYCATEPGCGLDDVYLGGQPETTYSAFFVDCNNNNNNDKNTGNPDPAASLGDQPHEPQYFDLQISPPEAGGAPGLEAFHALDIANWEEEFLENYVELPELIEFLPEKTPLCTETCEHVLHESSAQLQLHRKDTAAVAPEDDAPAEDAAKSEVVAATGYACTFGSCQKIYAKPAHLKAHLRRHLGEKPYVCTWPECSWKFSRSDELARHRRSHSGVKPYTCDYCMKCFARSDHLTKHRKVHERRMLAASRAGTRLDGGQLPFSVLNVRPGRKRKNQIC